MTGPAGKHLVSPVSQWQVRFLPRTWAVIYAPGPTAHPSRGGTHLIMSRRWKGGINRSILT